MIHTNRRQGRTKANSELISPNEVVTPDQATDEVSKRNPNHVCGISKEADDVIKYNGVGLTGQSVRKVLRRLFTFHIRKKQKRMDPTGL
uniref:Uncharacterized protein n=1 Tax=Strigamia maritima TaxID=126957 RepID=T1JC49_STRMM